MACARLPEGGSVEGVGCGGLGGELNHLMQAGFVGLPPLRVVPLHETGLLSVVSAGSDKGFKEAGEGHGLRFSGHNLILAPLTVPFPSHFVDSLGRQGKSGKRSIA